MKPIEVLIVWTILFSLLANFIPKSRRPRWLFRLPALAAILEAKNKLLLLDWRKQ